MATLTVQQAVPAGLNPSYASADGTGDEFAWGRHTFLHVKNGDASEHTATIASQYSSDPPGLTSNDLAVAIPAGEERIIGPLDEHAYKDSDGMVQVSYDAVTSVTVAAISA